MGTCCTKASVARLSARSPGLPRLTPVPIMLDLLEHINCTTVCVGSKPIQRETM